MWWQGLDRRWPIQIGFGTLLVAATFLITPPSLANDLDIESETTFTVKPDEGTVEVSAEYTLTNNTRSRTRDGIITSYYYHYLTVPVPETAENIRATSAGRTLKVSIEEEDFFRWVDVSLRKNLWAGQTQTFVLTYDLPSQPPRSGELVRVNPAYAAFPAYGVGDEGAVSVRVLVPRGFEVDVLGADVTRGTPEGDDFLVYEALEIEDPDEWFIFVTARNDDGLAYKMVSDDDRVAIIRHWPDDEGWRRVVEKQFTDSLPVMEDLIGVEWPLEDDLEIIETVSPNLYGAAGWFILDESLIEIDEGVDPGVILHEFAHAWFNHETIANRWLSEGLAEELANRTLQANRGGLFRPEQVDESTPGAIPLNSWDLYRDETLDNDRSAYAYDASYLVIRTISDEIGLEALREVLVAMDQGHAAYLGEAPPGETEPLMVDWRRFLDLTEEMGGSEVIDDLFAEYVVNPHHLDDLKERDSLRAQYQGLQDHGDNWAAPATIRRSMEEWDFNEAATAIVVADGILDRRDELVTGAAALGLSPNGRLEKLYENAAADLTIAVTDSYTHLASLEAVDSARRRVEAERGLFTQIGLWGGADHEQSYQAVRASYENGQLLKTIADANRLMMELDQAEGTGQERAMTAALAVSGLLALALAVRIFARRRRAGFLTSLEAGPEPFIGPVLPQAVTDSAEAVDL